MHTRARPHVLPPTFFVPTISVCVGFLIDVQALGAEVVVQDSVLSPLSTSMVLASGVLAVSTGHVGGALLAVMTAAVAFWQVRDLRLRKQIRNLESALAKTSQELEAAKAANEDFLSNISHDLRNPISGILGLSQALEETRLDAAQRKLTESIRSCTSLLSGLIDDLLDSAKLQSGQIELNEGTFDLQSCIDNAVTLSLAHNSTRSPVSVKINPKVPRQVFGDQARLQQILLNFISNAHKFGAGKPISVGVEALTHRRIRISVRDEGYGLSRAERELLFRPLATLHSDRALRGSGQGLATCRVLAKRMGGAVGVDSTVGEGSCFWAELPLDRPSTDAVPGAALSTLHNASALIVEDIDYSAAATEAILRSLGFRAESVSDGPTALKRLEAAQYDLVLMDWNIPGLAGTEVAARFRAKENTAHRTIIIATTAYSADRNRDACLAAGMNAFIAKPLTPEKISAELRRLGTTTGHKAPTTRRETNASSTSSELDLQILRFLSDGTDESLRSQIARFRNSFESDLATAHVISRGGQTREIASIAHRLISHAAAINCAPIVELAGRLQRLAGVLSPCERDQLLRAIEREFVVLKGKLEGLPISTRPD